MAKKKKQSSNLVGWVILAAIGLGIYQFGIAPGMERSSVATARPANVAASPARPQPAAVPLDAPRFVDVASLNVRHTPSTSSPLVMTLPRGTALRVIGRQDGWLLIDINPTLEGWVSEQLTTTSAPKQAYRPPAAVKASR